MFVRYVRTPFAAVAAEFAAQAAAPSPTRVVAQRQRKKTAVSTNPAAAAEVPVRTLWADRPLPLAGGHAVALRQRGEQLWVAVRRRGDLPVEWHLAEVVLTPRQAQGWASRARFEPA